MQESKKHEKSLFVTLTYNTDHVPITKNGFMTLDKRDIQLFFKRLRKNTGQTNIKYYACGEYGGHTNRPHYHLIIFNALEHDIEKAWRKDNEEIGTIHFGKLSEASVGYTLKYISKGKQDKKHARDDRQPEFSLMSKKMGADYLSEKMLAWHKADPVNRFYIPLKDGRKIPIPRYYKEKMFNKWEKERIVAALMLKEQKREAQELWGKSPEQIDRIMTQKELIRIEKGRKSQKEIRKNLSL